MEQLIVKITINLNPRSLSAVLLAVAMFAVAPVYAQGNVDGYIVGHISSDSGPVSEARVTVTNLDTGTVKTTSSSSSGGYRFSKLSPGRYEIRVAAAGYQSTIEEVLVNVGEGRVANQVLIAGDIEEVIITSYASSIDVMQSETTTIITSMDIERLPIPRDINAIALLAPGAVYGDTAFGVAKTSSHYSTNYGLVSFGGASVGENAYYINGMNVTNFRNGLGGSTIPFEFYDQFQLKTGGYGAEFGRSTGGVLNAITRRGTNEWQFRTGFIYTPESLRSHSPNVADPSNPGEYDSVFAFDEDTRTEAFVSVGGPIIKDKLFIYGIYNLRDIKEDNFTGGGRLLKDVDEDPFWGVKVDWNITDSHSLEFTAFSDKKTTVRTSFVWDEATNTVGENLGETLINRGGENYILKYTGNLTERFTVSLLAGESTYDLTTAAPADTVCPFAYDSRGGGLTQIGCWTNALPSAGRDERNVYRADIEWAIADRHLLRFGVDYEENTSFDNTMYSGGEYFRYFDSIPGESLPNGGTVPAGVTEITRYRQFFGGGDFNVINKAFYIEDEWLVTDSLTLRIGLRNERFDNRNAANETFIKITDQYAPRIGISWDVKGDGDSKVFANFGRYHLPIASNTNVRLSGAELFTQEWFVLDSPIDPTDASTVLGAQIGPTSVFGDGTVPDVRTTIDLDIKPMYQDEFILGYETKLWDGYIAGISFVNRDMKQGIEDITIDEAIGVPFLFHYILVNPGEDVHTFFDVDGDGTLDELFLTAEELGFPPIKRKYYAVNMFLEKIWNGTFYLKGTYTWSRSHGNYEGLVRSDNGQDDAGITTLYDFAGLMDGADGNLPNHRRHVLKVWGAWEFAPGWQTSGTFAYASGRPKNAFGVHPTDPFASLYGAESFYNQGVLVQRGSLGTTPAVTTVDAGLKYTLDLGNSTVTIRLDAFNIFNFNKATEFDEQADENSGVASVTFDLPTRFQRPRSIRLGVYFDYAFGG